MLALVMVLMAGKAAAQDRIIVQGLVTNSGDGNKPLNDGGVHIYGYNTVGEARDAYISAKNAWISSGGMFDPGLCIEVFPDNTGFYEIRVPASGALLFFYAFSSEAEPQMILVNGRNKINCQFDLNIQLEESKITAGDGRKLEVKPPEPDGNLLPVVAKWPFPKDRMGKSDARFGLQTFVLDTNKKDTLEFRQTVVMDGKEYHETQERRMGYESSRDPLMNIAERYPELSTETTYAYINDTIVLNPPSKRVYVKARMWLEDYNQVYFDFDQQLIDTRRMRRPMRFLEYALEGNSLNFNDPEYVRKARRELMDHKQQLDIKFLLGKAQIDPADSASVAALESISSTIRGIIQNEETNLKEYYINGVASPEGGYAKNQSLAKERMNYIAHVVNSQMSQSMQERVYKETHARVATWEELADLMWADSLKTEAEEIREAAAKYPNSMDQQGAQMRRLPYYNTLIKDYLPALRSVEFIYKVEVFRELSPDEVVERYRTDENFREGKNGKEFTPYEFWVLMQRLTDPKELEPICKRAIKQAKDNGDNWPLPSNILAQIYINRRQADTTILAPFVEEFRGVVNYSLMNMNGTRSTRNPAPVVANQAIMQLLEEKYQRAVYLVEMLKDLPEYDGLRTVVRSLAGYFKPGKPGSTEIYDKLHESSPRNAVVMDLAMNYWSFIPDELELLDPEDPVTYYLRAQYVSKEAGIKGNDFDFWDSEVQNTAIRNLVKAFQRDESLIDIADGDWDMNEKLFKLAKKEYDEPQSVLPPEPEPGAVIRHYSDLTKEEKEELIRKAYANEDMTEDEQRMYEESFYE